MEQQYLIDSNAVIDYLGSKFTDSGMSFMNNIINASPNVSVITRIEVLGFNGPKEYQNLLVNFINDINVLDLSDTIVEICIALRRKYKTKLPDAIIAATAIANNFTLISRNISDFEKIQELRVLDVYSLA